MRGMLLSGESAQYIVAVEYLLEESGSAYDGGQYDWEGSFVPTLPYSLNASGYILELEDGRRGRISIVQRRVLPDQPSLFVFRGHAGVHS